MLRLCLQDDYKDLAEMLSVEGIKENEMAFKDCATWVVDENGVKGFFSMRMEENLPYLVHLCVKRQDRSPTILWRMARYFRNVIRSLGYKKALINTPKGENNLSRLVSRYFHVRPYAADSVVQFYLVEV